MSAARFPVRYSADYRTLALLCALSALFTVQYTHLSAHPLLLPLTYVFVLVPLVAKHNHNHCPTFRSRGWNNAFGIWLTLLSGTTTTGTITAHNRLHHGSNQSPEDFVRCSLAASRRNWINFLSFFFVASLTMWRNRPDDLRAWRRSAPSLYRQAIRERIALATFLIALVAWDWRAALIYFAGPWLFGQWFLVTINLLQHQDCDEASTHNHSRNITGRLINWILLNNGFHTSHHNSPGTHWSALPALHRSMAAEVDPVLNERSLLVCVWRRFIVGKAWSGRHV